MTQPRQTYSVLTPATVEPLTLADAKEHCRIISGDEDAYLTALIAMARSHVEHATERAVVPQTFRLTMDHWPLHRTIELRKPPVQAVTSVQYVDGLGTLQTLDASRYHVDVDSAPARVVLDDGEHWPTLDVRPAAVRVSFVAGWTTPPPALVHAMRLLVGHWMEQRQPVVTGTIATKIPLTIDAMLNQLRWGSY